MKKIKSKGGIGNEERNKEERGSWKKREKLTQGRFKKKKKKKKGGGGGGGNESKTPSYNKGGGFLL